MKSTSIETTRRISKVAEWLINGWSRARICENARENWGVSDSQTDRYAAQAREMIRASYKNDWEDNRAMADMRLEYLFCRALEANDLRLAVKIVGEQTKLRRPDTAQNAFASEDEVVYCLAAYADALRRILPKSMLVQVVDAVRELTPVAESLEEIIGFDYDGAMALAVEDHKRLGRGRTREELIEDGVFDGLMLPD